MCRLVGTSRGRRRRARTAKSRGSPGLARESPALVCCAAPHARRTGLECEFPIRQTRAAKCRLFDARASAAKNCETAGHRHGAEHIRARAQASFARARATGNRCLGRAPAARIDPMASAEQIRRAIQAEAAPVKGEWTGVVKKTKPDGVPKPRGARPSARPGTMTRASGSAKPVKPALKNATSAPRARQKTQRLSDLVDAGKTYAKPKKNALSEAPTPEKSPDEEAENKTQGAEAASESRGRRGGAALCSRRGQRGISCVWPGRAAVPRRRRQRGFRSRRDHEPISAAEAAQTKKGKAPRPSLDSLSSLPPPGTKKAPQRVKPRPFLDTKRCTQPPGPRVPKNGRRSPNLSSRRSRPFLVESSTRPTTRAWARRRARIPTTRTRGPRVR